MRYKKKASRRGPPRTSLTGLLIALPLMAWSVELPKRAPTDAVPSPRAARTLGEAQLSAIRRSGLQEIDTSEKSLPGIGLAYTLDPDSAGPGELRSLTVVVTGVTSSGARLEIKLDPAIRLVSGALAWNLAASAGEEITLKLKPAGPSRAIPYAHLFLQQDGAQMVRSIEIKTRGFTELPGQDIKAGRHPLGKMGQTPDGNPIVIMKSD